MDNNKEGKNVDTEEQKIEGEAEKVSEIVAALEKLERVDQEENEILGKPRSQQSLSHQGEQNAEEDTKCEEESGLYLGLAVPSHACHDLLCHRLPLTGLNASVIIGLNAHIKT